MSDNKSDSDESESVPTIDFATFVLSLASSALVHLGELPHPERQKAERHLPLAKQTIDVIGMLQEKTRGNLSKEESELIEHMLFDLRMKYVAAQKS